jgi:methionine-rich copper-binding protein CopC
MKPRNKLLGRLVTTLAAACFGIALFNIHPAFALTNLVTNPGAETGNFNSWTKVDGGSGWFVSGFRHSGTYSFLSSYEWGTLSQEIDLVAAGYTGGALDAQPQINFSTWLAGYDSGSGTNDPYSVTVELRDASHAVVTSYATGDQTANGTWTEISRTFTSYGTGVRYVYVQLRGKDSSWWAGNYGTAFDDTAVSIGVPTPPTVTTLSPADNSAAGSAGGNLTMTFNETVNIGTGNIVIYKTSDNSTFETIDVASGQVTGGGTSTITINPNGNLLKGTSYYVQFPWGGVSDTQSTVYAGISDSTTWNFTVHGSSNSQGSNAGSGSQTQDNTITNLVATNPDASTVILTWTNGQNVPLNKIFLSTNNGDAWTAITEAAQRTSYTWNVAEEYQGQSVTFKVISTDLATELGSATVNLTLANATQTENEPAASPTSSPVSNNDETADAPTTSDTETVPTTGTSPWDGTTEAIDNVQANSYVRGTHFDTVYYVDEHRTRHPFLNSQIYFTWEDSFDDIVTVTDATLPTLTIGSPMLPKAGVVLVKIQSNPSVSMIETNESGEAILREIPEESTASLLFGSTWSDYVIDLPPTLFAHFTHGDAVTTSSIAQAATMKTRSQLQAANQSY